MVLMNPDVLSISQNENNVNMDDISTCVHDSTPIIENNSDVEISVSDTGVPSIEIDGSHPIFEEVKDDNIVVKPEQIVNPEHDTLFEIDKLLDVVENPEHDAFE